VVGDVGRERSHFLGQRNDGHGDLRSFGPRAC
jgi:hypothetical protein